MMIAEKKKSVFCLNLILIVWESKFQLEFGIE